jgi:hypothetical protein
MSDQQLGLDEGAVLALRASMRGSARNPSRVPRSWLNSLQGGELLVHIFKTSLSSRIKSQSDKKPTKRGIQNITINIMTLP